MYFSNFLKQNIHTISAEIKLRVCFLPFKVMEHVCSKNRIISLSAQREIFSEKIDNCKKKLNDQKDTTVIDCFLIGNSPSKRKL